MENGKLHEAVGNIEKIDNFQCLLRMSFSDRKYLPRVPALYFVHLPKLILYIGLTTDLSDRIKEHHHIWKFRSAHALTDSLWIAWFPVRDFQMARICEAEFIKNLFPPFNYGKLRSKAWQQLSSKEEKQLLRASV